MMGNCLYSGFVLGGAYQRFQIVGDLVGYSIGAGRCVGIVEVEGSSVCCGLGLGQVCGFDPLELFFLEESLQP